MAAVLPPPCEPAPADSKPLPPSYSVDGPSAMPLEELKPCFQLPPPESEEPKLFTPPANEPEPPDYEDSKLLFDFCDAKPSTDAGAPLRKASMIPGHLATLQGASKTSKPLTPLQELLAAVINSTAEDDSPGGGTPEPEHLPPHKPLKPLARLKQGVEQYRKLGKGPPGGKTKKKSKLPGGGPHPLKKTTLTKTKKVAPGGGNIVPGEVSTTPPQKQETAAEKKQRVSQVTALLGREETPEEKRSHKKKIPLINIGERILIYWPMDRVFYSGKVVEHVVAKHRYTVLYDDNEMEVLDLSKEIWRPGTLDPKKERMPGEGIQPPELGLPLEGDIPHYMPPRKRRRFEKTKKGGKWGQGKVSKDASSEQPLKKKRKKMMGGKDMGEKPPIEGGVKLPVADGGPASVQEMGAVEALLGVAGNKFGVNAPQRTERGPIFIGLKKKRSKQGEGKLIRLASTLDRSASSGYLNGWSSSPGGGHPGQYRPSSASPKPPGILQPGTSDASDPPLRTHPRRQLGPMDGVTDTGGRKPGSGANGLETSDTPTCGEKGAFAPGSEVLPQNGVNAPNGAMPVPLPPAIQQILTDFERRKLEKEGASPGGGKGPGLKRGGKRKRKFTPKPKGSGYRAAKAQQPLVRKRSFGETQFVELACGGALIVNAGGMPQQGGGKTKAKVKGGGVKTAKVKGGVVKEEKVVEGGLEVEKLWGDDVKVDMAKAGSRLMRSAAVVAQKRIEATAGGTIAPAEVEAYRRGGIEVPRKRARRESHPARTTPPSSLSAGLPTPDSVLPPPKAEPPSGDQQKPASRRLWWLDAFGAKPEKPVRGELDEELKPTLGVADEVKIAAKASTKGAGKSVGGGEAKQTMVQAVAHEEASGETKAASVFEVGLASGTGYEKPDVERVGRPSRVSDVLGGEQNVGVLENGDDISGMNEGVQEAASTPVNDPPTGHDSEHSPKGEVVNVDDGANTGESGDVGRGPGLKSGHGVISNDGVNEPPLAVGDMHCSGGEREFVMDAVNGASDTDGVNGLHTNGALGEKAAADGVNGFLGSVYCRNGPLGGVCAGNAPLGGVYGPETSRVESDSTAAVQPQLENGSSGQQSAPWQKLAAKTLADIGGVAKWLKVLGLGRLVSLFVEHEVSEAALPHLTSDDLKEMGMKAIGTRRLVLNNIELLKQGIIGDAHENVSQ